MSLAATHKSARTRTPPEGGHERPRRENRLYPARFSRLYYHLAQLRQELENVIALDTSPIRDGTLVDYGCGDKPYRALFAPLVREYIGADLAGNPQADLLLDARGCLPVASASADIVLSSQVLEHVPDPTLYLAECFRVLKPTGRLILSTHGMWRFHPDPTDYWRWTSAGLHKIARESGFHILRFRGIMGPPSYALQLLQDCAAPMLPPRLRPALFGPMQLMIQLADFLCPESIRQRDASVFLFVAEKDPQRPRPA